MLGFSCFFFYKNIKFAYVFAKKQFDVKLIMYFVADILNGKYPRSYSISMTKTQRKPKICN